MKNTLLAICLMLISQFLMAQISLEQTYNYSGTYVHLKNSGDKFYTMDVVLNECRIYNTDHTIWKTITLSVPENNYLYDIKFVSEGLFTTNSTLCLAYIYYNYDDVNLYYTFNARIITEQGNELLFVPGCQYISTYSTQNEGNKLITFSYDYSIALYTTTTRVYSLPGQSVGISDFHNYDDEPRMSAFPNPTNEYITIPYNLPEGIKSGQLIISNANGNIIKNIELTGNQNSVNFQTDQLPVGMYLYSIQNDNTVLLNGKFIKAR